MKQVPHWGSTNIMCRRSKCTRVGFMQPCTRCFGQCSCFVDVHFLTLTCVSRHDQVRNCGARSVRGLSAGDWGIASNATKYVNMSLRLYFGVNLLLLYFTNLADCCYCGVHFHRADTVHAVKKHSTVFTVNWICLSVCLSALCSAVRTPE